MLDRCLSDTSDVVQTARKYLLPSIAIWCLELNKICSVLIEHYLHKIESLVQVCCFSIENLLKNALDAMEGRGRITIDILPGPAGLALEVTDTGKGIAKANMNKVFNPGFTTKKRGWGLGLTLTRRIIAQYHNGNIAVKWSEPGKGTTFRIELKNAA